jgi:hypothetical protein
MTVPLDPVPDEATLQHLAASTIADYEQWKTSSGFREDCDRIHHQLTNISRRYERRVIPEALDAMRISEPLTRWVIELFLAFRDRTAMMDYLRFQESADVAPSGNDPLAVVQTFLNDEIIPLGRKTKYLFYFHPLLLFKPKWKIPISVDPFVNIRAVYANLLLDKRKHKQRRHYTWFVVQYHRCLAWCKVQLWHLGLLLAKKKRGELLSPVIILLFFARFFPDLSKCNREQLVQVLAAAKFHFIDRIQRLIPHVPRETLRSGGLAKFVKVIIGTLVGVASARPQCRDGAEVAESVCRALAVAANWAVTYPLVDDVLDSAATDQETRHQLTQLFMSLSLGQPVHVPKLQVLHQRMLELLGCIPIESRSRVSQAIWNVFLAHKADAEGVLAEVNSSTDVVVVSLLKSLLVRTATMEISSMPATKTDYQSMAGVALFNQFGDDIWDAHEDMASSRLTPVTQYLTHGGVNPYHDYIYWGAYLASKNHAHARPIALAICHTLQLAYQAGTQRTRTEIKNTLRDFAPRANASVILKCARHIDPDSVIFDFDAAIRWHYLPKNMN